MPEGALFSISNAAVYGVVQALQAEYRSKPQRINEASAATLRCAAQRMPQRGMRSLRLRMRAACPSRCCHPTRDLLPCGLPLGMQLRIGAIVRRDSEEFHPAFPGMLLLLLPLLLLPLLLLLPPPLLLPLLLLPLLPPPLPTSPRPRLLRPAGKKAYPASLVGQRAVEIALGGQSDEVVRLYLD